MKRFLYLWLPVGLMVLLVARVGVVLNGRVIAQESFSNSGPVIKVREMQTNPLSITGLLGIGEVLYRAEFSDSENSRMLAAISLTGESQYGPGTATVKWSDYNHATVTIKGSVFQWNEREWRRAK